MKKQTIIGIATLLLVLALFGLMFYAFVYKNQPKETKPSIEVTIDGHTYEVKQIN